MVPRKIRQLLKDYQKAGFFIVIGAGKGDHRKLRHQKIPGSIIVDGKSGSDCRHYQEKDLQTALRNLEQVEKENEKYR